MEKGSWCAFMCDMYVVISSLTEKELNTSLNQTQPAAACGLFKVLCLIKAGIKSRL